MKMTSKLMKTSLALATLIPAFLANAQYKPTGDDGLTASPKTRLLLNELERSKHPGAVASASMSSHRVSGDGIAASPKVRMRLEEKRRDAEFATTFPSVGAVASTTKAPTDGIAASPKVRDQMRDHVAPAQVEIAPITQPK